MLDLKHMFNFFQTTLIKPIHWKSSHWLLELVVISKTKDFKQQPGFFQISPNLADIILLGNNIKRENGWKLF